MKRKQYAECMPELISQSVRLSVAVFGIYLCVVFVASGHLHRYFLLLLKNAYLRFISISMLHLARIFEQTQQILAIPRLFSLP